MTTIKKFVGRPRTTKPERYHHLRRTSVVYENGREVTNVTAFIRENDEGQLQAAYAECDSRDAFDRRRGRNVARRKWFQGKRSDVPSAKYEDVFAEYLEEESAEEERSAPSCELGFCI